MVPVNEHKHFYSIIVLQCMLLYNMLQAYFSTSFVSSQRAKTSMFSSPMLNNFQKTLLFSYNIDLFFHFKIKKIFKTSETITPNLMILMQLFLHVVFSSYL